MELLKALFESAELPAEFKEKTTTLFEAAVAERLAAEIVTVQEAADKKLGEAKEAFIAEAVATIDAVVEETVLEWAKENAVALDSEVKGQIAESFLKGLKGIFEQADIELSGEGASAVVAQLQEQNAELTKQADAAKVALVEAQAQLTQIKVKEILAEMTEGLADTQIDRVIKLVESFEFKSEEDFRAKTALVVEAVGGKVVAEKKIVAVNNNDGAAIAVTGTASQVTNKVETPGVENEDGELVHKPAGASVPSAEGKTGKPESSQVVTQPNLPNGTPHMTFTPPGVKEQVESIHEQAAPHLHSDLVAETLKLFK